MAHEHHHGHEHDHGALHFVATDVTEDVLKEMMALHPPLAANLGLARRFGELSDDEKQRLPGTQREVETYPVWTPGYHAAGDRCATCGKETAPLFSDRFQEGSLPYAAFVAGLPVHATEACIGGFARARPDVSPRAVDIARRTLMKDLDRPTPTMSQFFRHDLFAHPPFALEDWANSVAEANKGRLDRQTVRDMERLMVWVHGKLYHAH